MAAHSYLAHSFRWRTPIIDPIIRNQLNNVTKLEVDHIPFIALVLICLLNDQ